MARGIILCFAFIFILAVSCSNASFVFHENTHVKFVPENDDPDSYFGYSAMMSPDGLFIGAPRASNQFTTPIPYQKTGLIYFCSLKTLNIDIIYCNQLQKRKRFYKNKMLNIRNQDLVEDSWFGSSMALIEDNLLVTAPRLTSPFTYDNDTLSLLQGGSYIVMRIQFKPLYPLADNGNQRNQLYRLNGTRTDFGKDTDTYYFSLGQFGFSMAVTKKNTMIFGAPGLLGSAGGIISYMYKPGDKHMQTYLQPITNPYNTTDLDADDNFGYSVDSGTFMLNGSVFYVGGAPRYKLARGKVLVIAVDEPEYRIFKENEIESMEPLDVRAKLIGPQVGAYFGASICCADINGDGLDDLLVGAPMFVTKDDNLPYDQGAVFVYITEETESGFTLNPSGYVTGSRKNAARFGTTIADLGDVNGDSFRDVAIGAPWEDDGIGAVYIYMGYERGLKTDKVQKIQPVGAQGFGWSITKGVDIDNNTCNDVVIGAYQSVSAYLYRCVPTMHVTASINVSAKINLPLNTTTFTAWFCVSSPPIEATVKLDMIGKIQMDPTDNRSSVIDGSEYSVTLTPNQHICHDKIFNVDIKADLRKPILLRFELEANELMKDNSTTFLLNTARLSDESILNVSVPVEVMSDCGEDFKCTPWLNMRLEALDNPYVPGSAERLGIRLSVRNVEEPGYGLSINLTLPLHPKRIPSECSFQNPKITCNLPQPFLRNDFIMWEIEMDYNINVTRPINLTVMAELFDRNHNRMEKITAQKMKHVDIYITPEANITLTGKSMPNETMTIVRSSIAAGANTTFQHLFAITNHGPSDWFGLTAFIWIPDKTYLSSDIDGCEKMMFGYKCQWSIPAKVSLPVTVPLQVDLGLQGNYLKRHLKYNATSTIYIMLNQTQSEASHVIYEVTTKLIIEPANLLWCIVVPCIFLGFLLLAIIVRILHKCGFFKRMERKVEHQHSYRCIRTSETDQSSQDAGEENENVENEVKENSEVNQPVVCR